MIVSGRKICICSSGHQYMEPELFIHLVMDVCIMMCLQIDFGGMKLQCTSDTNTEVYDIHVHTIHTNANHEINEGYIRGGVLRCRK